MDFSLLHPRDQLVKTMQRIYGYSMTTTSGGNLSIRDENGDVWITPSAIDKGSLKPQDIVCVKKDGSIEGLHKPSSEYPFHKAIYEARNDINAIVHAHPPALVTFSIVRQVPDTRIIPQAHHICGPVGYALYELPGSEKLGENIAKIFNEGYKAILMENHGTVVGGSNLSDAFMRFETLEFCASMIIQGSAIGKVKSLDQEQIDLFSQKTNLVPELDHVVHTSKEKELRKQIVDIVLRAYHQRLMISTYGTVSARIDKDTFLITPYGRDRHHLNVQDVVLIKNGHREKGKIPSRSVRLHQKIYKHHAYINSIISAQSPHATAYCITGQKFDTRTIPESYILLRDIPFVPFGSQFKKGGKISRTLSKETPILLLENDAILVTGGSVLETFDRLEVAEFSAKSLTQSTLIGHLVPINEQEIEDLKKKFLS
ncbi:MAG: class II aldolase/adducin family protein [Cyclobacteriaceae bacterium]